MLGAAGGIPGLSQLGALFGGTNPGSGTVFNQGGMVPSVKAMRDATKGAMPTGMPGMPPMPTLAPTRPGGQPNGQPASPFARGGAVGDEAQDKRMVTKAVHEHERALHKGSPLTMLRLAEGGSVGGMSARQLALLSAMGWF